MESRPGASWKKARRFAICKEVFRNWTRRFTMTWTSTYEKKINLVQYHWTTQKRRVGVLVTQLGSVSCSHWDAKNVPNVEMIMNLKYVKTMCRRDAVTGVGQQWFMEVVKLEIGGNSEKKDSQHLKLYTSSTEGSVVTWQNVEMLRGVNTFLRRYSLKTDKGREKDNNTWGNDGTQKEDEDAEQRKGRWL